MKFWGFGQTIFWLKQEHISPPFTNKHKNAYINLSIASLQFFSSNDNDDDELLKYRMQLGECCPTWVRQILFYRYARLAHSLDRSQPFSYAHGENGEMVFDGVSCGITNQPRKTRRENCASRSHCQNHHRPTKQHITNFLLSSVVSLPTFFSLLRYPLPSGPSFS